VPTLPARSIVLTFDDAVKSHRTFVGPLLKELGFRASFFVTHAWMQDRANFMTWEDIGELHAMGFEIGNHTWTHAGMSQPRSAARLDGELSLVERELARVKVPRPESFAWPGNGFGPEALAVLRARGYKLARRGGMPEVEYGRATVGPLYDPARRHALLIPTTADAYPNWRFEHFQSVMARAPEGKAVVLQFHGVPDVSHPWVHTEPELFRRCMQYLKDQGFRTMALRDLQPYAGEPQDPLLTHRHPIVPVEKLRWPAEVEAARQNPGFWLSVMRRHGYNPLEIEQVMGNKPPGSMPPPAGGALLPYPGGRHPRVGFLDGAVGPMRGTKASLFLPWDPESYLVIDVPEAIIASSGIIFLAHTHIPTVWDAQNKVIDNVDWTVRPDGSLESSWELPDKTAFGAGIKSTPDGADMELWLRNGTSQPLTRMRAQVCIMLKGARGFDQQTNDNKDLTKTEASVRSGGRTIRVEWEPVNRVWANPPCPCMHSDPALPDCSPGETVRARGRIRWS